MGKNYLSIAIPTLQHPTSFSVARPALPERKLTSLGLYVTAKEAYIKWQSDPDNVKIIDCRTPEEYILTGHAPMAHNIPISFMTHRFDEKKKRFIMEDNQGFVELVKNKFELNDTIMIICRSGSRSAKAVNKLADAGFKKVYTVTDGFEENQGQETKSGIKSTLLENGWKNVENPWTYTLEPNLVYTEEKRKFANRQP